jgi:hypothetical protein
VNNLFVKEIEFICKICVNFAWIGAFAPKFGLALFGAMGFMKLARLALKLNEAGKVFLMRAFGDFCVGSDITASLPNFRSK